MNTTRNQLLAMLSAGVFSIGAFATELSYTSHNRLMNTETAVTVPAGGVELTVGLDFTTRSGRRGFDNNWGITQRDKVRVYDWNMTARYGVNDDLDVFLRTGWVDIKDRSYPYGDDYARGVDDLTLGMKYVIWRDREDTTVAYQPSLTVPIRAYKSKDGRLGASQNFWSFDQTLAVTRDWNCVSGSMAVTQTIPFGESRHHYSRPFMQEQRHTRGTTGIDVGMVYTDLPIQPLVELNYLHEWVSSGNDADLLATTMGARMPIPGVGLLMAGVQYPLAGRNSYRGTTLSMGLTAEF